MIRKREQKIRIQHEQMQSYLTNSVNNKIKINLTFDLHIVYYNYMLEETE